MSDETSEEINLFGGPMHGETLALDARAYRDHFYIDIIDSNEIRRLSDPDSTLPTDVVATLRGKYSRVRDNAGVPTSDFEWDGLQV